MQLFSNNARAVLAQVLLTQDPVQYWKPQTRITVAADGGADTFALQVSESESSDYQYATLSHDSVPDVYEVVKLIQRPSTNEYEVSRGEDGTEVLEWPIGTVMEGRVTAGMLGELIQNDPSRPVVCRDIQGVMEVPGDKSFLAGCRVHPYRPQNMVQISGWPVLQEVRRDNLVFNLQDANQIAPEVMGCTMPISLGRVDAWASGRYDEGAILRPAVDDGYQYVLACENPFASGGSRAGGDILQEPDFANGLESGKYILVPMSSYGTPIGDGRLIQVSLPLDEDYQAVGNTYAYYSGCGQYLMPTEIGFVCTKFDGTAAPSVSIGTPEDHTCFVNNQSMEQISGVRQCQRWPITAGGALVQHLHFKTETPATGVFEGFFFWRGVIMNLLPD